MWLVHSRDTSVTILSTSLMVGSAVNPGSGWMIVKEVVQLGGGGGTISVFDLSVAAPHSLFLSRTRIKGKGVRFEPLLSPLLFLLFTSLLLLLIYPSRSLLSGSFQRRNICLAHEKRCGALQICYLRRTRLSHSWGWKQEEEASVADVCYNNHDASERENSIK